MSRWGANLAGDARGGGLLLGASLSIVMCIALLAQSSNDASALAWGLIFGALAVIQLARYLRRRRR
jgi:hypothetical protein